MNDNNDLKNVKPYKATGNMNTVIDNPDAYINNMMNVNIEEGRASDLNMNNNSYNNNPNNFNPTPNIDKNINSGNASSEYVTRTFVSLDNKPKKKTTKIVIGSELKTVILISVIIFLFILVLPIISEFITGY